MKSSLKQQIALPLGQIPSGCFVLTARDGKNSTGILASWVQQAGFDPPTLTVAVGTERPIRELIEKSGQFVVNIIDEKNYLSMFKKFAKGFKIDQPAFEGLHTRMHAAGVIVEDCMAHLCCEVIGSVNAGDHFVFVGRITDGGQHAQAEPCVHIRTNGFSY